MSQSHYGVPPDSLGKIVVRALTHAAEVVLVGALLVFGSLALLGALLVCLITGGRRDA